MFSQLAEIVRCLDADQTGGARQKISDILTLPSSEKYMVIRFNAIRLGLVFFAFYTFCLDCHGR